MAKDKVTDRDARLFWEACAAAALSGAATELGEDSGNKEVEREVVGTAYALADGMLSEWAEKFGYEGDIAATHDEGD